MHPFLLGALAMAALIIGLFFLRFWHRSGERLFVWFALAFWLLSLNWTLLALSHRDEPHTMLYSIRLLAFALIIGGIWAKNRQQPAGS